jgi:hypothetical protein
MTTVANSCGLSVIPLLWDEDTQLLAILSLFPFRPFSLSPCIGDGRAFGSWELAVVADDAPPSFSWLWMRILTAVFSRRRGVSS